MTDLIELAREPSPEGWRRLCEALDRMDEPSALAMVGKLEPALAAWPDELRATMCGMTWDDQFFDGAPNPRSAIVRYLRFDRHFSGRYDGSLRMRERNLTPATMRAMCRSPGLRHLTRVNLGYQLDAAGVRELAACPHFERLTHLELDGCKLDRQAVSALAGAEFYGRLDELSLYNSKITASSVSALFGGGGAPKALVLSSNVLGPDGAEQLASSIHADTRKLVLAGCGLGTGGAAALATITTAVRSIDAGSNALGDDGLRALVGDSLRPNELVLIHDTITNAGVRAIVDAGWPLRSLDLTDNALDDDAAIDLATRGPETLEALTITDNDVTARGLAALIGSERLRGLRELRVGTNRVGALERLAPTMRGLTTLHLEHDRLGDGIRALAAIEAETLRDLSLAHNSIGVAAFQELTGASWFGNLETLNLANNPLGPGAGVLFGAWPISALLLAHTGLGDDGVTAMIGAGLHPKVLELDHCELTDRALEELAGSSLLSRVEILSLRNNAITDRGITALVKAAPPRLKQLKLQNNRVGDDGVVALAGWDQLLYIGADHNPYGKRAEVALEALPTRCCP